MREAAREQRIQDLEAQLSIANRRIQQLELENRALAGRAALAVTQEADRIAAAPVPPVECYRCGHAAKDAGCPCCADEHTPQPDGGFTLATREEFEQWKANQAL